MLPVLDQHKVDKAGSNTMAANIFSRNINVSKIPISIWNLSAEKTKCSPMPKVNPVKITAPPRSCKASNMLAELAFHWFIYPTLQKEYKCHNPPIPIPKAIMGKVLTVKPIFN